MCRAGEFNLSYESLTSRAARQNLRDLHETETEFLAELRRPRSHVLAPVLSHDEALLEDSEELELDIPGDDSSVPLWFLSKLLRMMFMATFQRSQTRLS